MVVAVVGGLVLTLAAGALRTLSAPERYESSLGYSWDVTVEQHEGPPRTAEIAALPGVARIETATFVFGGIIPVGAEAPAESLVFAGSFHAFGTDIVEGREPDPSQPGEFVATRTFLELTGAQVGDRFTLITITQAQADEFGFDAPTIDGPTLDATLVGALDGATELQDDFAIAAFPSALLDIGDVGVSASQNSVEFIPGVTIEEFRRQLDTLPDGAQFGIDVVDLVPKSVRDAASARGNGVAILAAIVGLATVVVLGQLLGRQVRPTDAQALAMRSMGMTPAQLVAEPLAQAAVPVAAGAVVAGLGAIAISGAFPLGFVANIEPDHGLRLEPVVHLLGPLLLAVAILGWVLVSLLLGRRPALAHRGPGLIDAVASRVRVASAATGVRFAFDRSPGEGNSIRYALGGLVVVLAGLVAAVTFGASLGRLIDEPARYGSYDLMVGQGGGAIADDIRSRLDADPDIAALGFGGTVFVTAAGSTSLDVTAIEQMRGDLDPHVFRGRLPVSAEEIALGKVSARDLGVDVGEDLTIDGATGERALRVTGLIVVPGIEGGDGVGHGGLVTVEGLRQIDPEAELTAALLDLRPGAPVNTAARIAGEIDMAVGPPSPGGEIINLDRIRAIPFVVAAALAVLAVLSLAHQLILSAQRRRRDIAVLRAMGADRRWVTAVVHWQASVFAGLALVVALPVGFVAGRLIFRAFIDRLGARTEVTVAPWLLAGAAVGLLALANVVGALAAVRSRRAAVVRLLTVE